METALEEPQKNSLLFNALKKGRSFLWWSGLLMILLGVAAVAYPGLFTLSLAYLVSGLFIFGGCLTLIASFAMAGTGPFFGALLLSLLQIACGVMLYKHPGIASWALTLIIAVTFMWEGATQFALAFEIKPTKGWGWTLFSAVISVLAGLSIVAAMPIASIWVVGFLFGINFISSGISSIVLSKSIPKV